MGQPILGIRDNIGTISQEQIIEFQKTHYVGQNIVIVGAGNIQHEQLSQLAEKYFGNLPATSPTGLDPKSAEKPLFTPSIMMMRDDEMANANIGVFFEAPSWSDPDYYSFLLFQRILGEYTQDKYTGAHLNTRSFNI